MSADEPTLALPTGLTPLSAGPVPLTLWQARGWALGLLLTTLAIGFGLPWLARGLNAPGVEPDRIIFGNASVAPAPGWTPGPGTTAQEVTLTKSGTWITFTDTAGDGSSAAVRVQVLAEQMREEYPQLTVTTEPRAFPSAGRTPGQLAALAGTTSTSIVASVVDGPDAVDVRSLGQSGQFSQDVSGIQAMLESIRFLPTTGSPGG